MKNIKTHICSLLLTLGLLVSCDSGFDELNTNKTQPLALNPIFELNNAIIRSSFPTPTLIYEEAIVQQMVSPQGGVIAGGNFNQENRPVTLGLWQRHYQEVLKYVVDIMEKTRTDASRSNLYHMARIWRAYSAMVLTDTYGDVPYLEAGLGYLQNTATSKFPKYDTQEAIYTDILKELDEASAALDATKTKETSDILYAGDVARWKRLGYSLLLRAGMRLSKIDPTKAQTYVAKAVAGGIMQAKEDNGVVRHNGQYLNDLGNTLNASESGNYYLAATFVKYLKANKDPRLASIAIRYVGAKSGSDQKDAIATRDTTKQVGMPMGYDIGTIGTAVTNNGLASFYDFSQLDRNRIGSGVAPIFLVTLAQTKLLQAEAVLRGWVSGDAVALYREGIVAHLQQMGDYDPNSAISTDAIKAYADAHPLEASKELELINTQYWVASFLNGPEAFANFRRSGYPALTPNPYPGKAISGDFIRRLTYPDSEIGVNSGNIQQAIAHQGPDKLETRVWWDKP